MLCSNLQSWNHELSCDNDKSFLLIFELCKGFKLTLISFKESGKQGYWNMCKYTWKYSL